MLNPLMLLGLAGLAVPVLIHLINRQRMRPRLLATLAFLDRQDVANTFAPRPRDVLQLLLRLLLLALFVLLMARLTMPGTEVGPRAVAIVLDNSQSMKRLLPGGKTSLFAQHRQRILELLRTQRPDDFFAFVLVGDQVFASTGFTNDRAALEKAVQDAWVSDGSGRGLYAALVAQAKELRARRAPNLALLVFSDQQEANYRPHLDGGELAQVLRGSRVTPVFVQDRLEIQPNFELQAATFYPTGIHLGAGGKVSARVHNPAAAGQGSDSERLAPSAGRENQIPEVAVSLVSGGTPLDTRACKLAPGETAQLEMVTEFNNPLDTAWQVSIGEDGFAGDNERYTTVRMRKRREILLVAGPDYLQPEPNATVPSGVELFTFAVNPAEALGEPGGTYISVSKPVDAQSFKPADLARANVVVLYGVKELGAGMVRELRDFVEHGGGLWLVPDVKADPAEFNDKLGDLLLGAKLGGLQTPASPVPLDTNERQVPDPLLWNLLRGKWGTTQDLLFARYFILEQPGRLRPALKTREGGHVLLAAGDLGKGRVCLQLHSWNVEDTGLPRSLTFVAVVRAVVDRLSGADREESFTPDVIRAGDYYALPVPMFRGLGGDVLLNGPRKYTFPLPAEAAQVSIKDVYVAGTYRATHEKKPMFERWLAVNPAPGEAAPQFCEAAALTQLGGERTAIVTGDRLSGLFVPSRELYPWLLALVFVALIAETLMGVWLSRRVREVQP